VTTAAVPGFRPSVHGFPFANSWPPGPTVKFAGLDPRIIGIGDASAGLCGGMAVAVRDLYEAGLVAPADREPPANGSPRFQAIVRRQVQSLDWLRVPLRYFDLQALRPDPPTWWSRASRREPPRVVAIRDEWPKICDEIDDGHPSVVGLIRVQGLSPSILTRNHQVLAFGYGEEDGHRVLRIYDPNHPGNDTVELRATIDQDKARPMHERIALAQSTGEPLLGFFRQPYPAPGPMRAWR
jgi:hypothetical protein